MKLPDVNLLIYAADESSRHYERARGWLEDLAIEHGAELCSHDTDFARFPGLRWHDPLAAGA